MKPFAVAAVAILLSGCAAAPTPADATIRIVASTNVYGDIAETLGGDLVTVTSLIASPAQDPHSFEASARNQLDLSKADLVIDNGGGYDSFMGTLLDASGSTATRVTASDVVGLTAGANEHLWYSFPAMDAVAKAIASALEDSDPVNSELYRANYDAFTAQLATLESAAAAIPGAGRGVAITEPVPLYLLEGAGFVNRTPEAFTQAIEEGSDIPPAALAETLALFDSDAVALLAYNSQTASSETERVRSAAKAVGIPVVEFTETLPDGQDYVSWMTANIDSLTAAL
jgi:zinc/manganese transport system substrate-binding protein